MITYLIFYSSQNQSRSFLSGCRNRLLNTSQSSSSGKVRLTLPALLDILSITSFRIISPVRKALTKGKPSTSCQPCIHYFSFVSSQMPKQRCVSVLAGNRRLFSGEMYRKTLNPSPVIKLLFPALDSHISTPPFHGPNRQLALVSLSRV